MSQLKMTFLTLVTAFLKTSTLVSVNKANQLDEESPQTFLSPAGYCPQAELINLLVCQC